MKALLEGRLGKSYGIGEEQDVHRLWVIPVRSEKMCENTGMFNPVSQKNSKNFQKFERYVLSYSRSIKVAIILSLLRKYFDRSILF